MHQLELTHDTIDDALETVVKALGGAKKVGPRMRPELPQDQAANWLRDCINPHNRAKLSIDQFVWLLREARLAGVHSAFFFLSGEVGYQSQPVEPEDEQAQLMREFVSAQRGLAKLAEKLERAGLIRSVA